MALFDKKFTPCYPEDVEDLDATAQMLYVWLCKYSDVEGGGSWPSRKTLSENLKVSVDTVDDRMAKLISCGVVSKEERSRDNGSQTSNGYQIHRTKSVKASRQPAAPPSRQPAAPITNPVLTIETQKLQAASRPVVAKKKLEAWEEKEQIPGWESLNSIYQGAFTVWYGLGWKFPKRDDLEDYKKRIKTSLIKSGLADTTSQGTVAPHATLIEVELMRFRDHWRDKKIQLPLKAWETWTNNMAAFREKRR
jgi:hypothetical protein